jgi:hypothetical protein
MRVQLLSDHLFNTPSGGVALKEGSIVSDLGGADFPVGQIPGFAVDRFMFGLDGPGTAAVSGAGGPRYVRTPGQPAGGLLIPAGWSVLNWATA